MKAHELENLIMAAWITKEDIDSILWVLMDREKTPTEDELANLLIGLHTLHDARMAKLFNAYEQVLKTNKITYKGYDFSKNPSTL
jgi:hypothetical protein